MPQGQLQTAMTCLLRQQKVHDGFCFNLDALWRSVGSPPGRDPLLWARDDLAGPLLRGLALYFANLDRSYGITPADAMRGVIDEVFFPLLGDHAPDGWRLGDMLSPHSVANLYARYLDGDDATG